eukprot:2670858-Ditylum_brightwellii.AAC.1
MNAKLVSRYENELFNYFTTHLTKVSSHFETNKESLHKIKSNLDSMSCNISKIKYQLNKEEKLY